MKKTEKKIPIYLPEELRSIRARHGLSRSDFADLLDVNRSTVSRWESSDGCPRLAALAYLVLDRKPGLLLDDGDEGCHETENGMQSSLLPPRYVLLKNQNRLPKKEWMAADVRSLLEGIGKNFFLRNLADISGLSAPTVATWTSPKRKDLPKRTKIWLNLLWTRRLATIEKTGNQMVFRLENGENLSPDDVLAFLDNGGHFIQCSSIGEEDEPNSLRLVLEPQRKVDAKKIRQSLNLTQDQIAKLFGVSTLVVKNWEKSSVDELKGPGLRLYDFVRVVGLPAVKTLENLV